MKFKNSFLKDRHWILSAIFMPLGSLFLWASIQKIQELREKKEEARAMFGDSITVEDDKTWVLPMVIGAFFVWHAYKAYRDSPDDIEHSPSQTDMPTEESKSMDTKSKTLYAVIAVLVLISYVNCQEAASSEDRIEEMKKMFGLGIVSEKRVADKDKINPIVGEYTAEGWNIPSANGVKIKSLNFKEDYVTEINGLFYAPWEEKSDGIYWIMVDRNLIKSDKIKISRRIFIVKINGNYLFIKCIIHVNEAGDISKVESYTDDQRYKRVE